MTIKITELTSKKLKRIHVNMHHIRSNNKGDTKPVFTTKEGKKNIYGHKVDIIDEKERVIVTLVYHHPDICPDVKKLSCGARAYIETHMPVRITEYGFE